MLLYLSLSDEWWLLACCWIFNYFSVASPVGLIPAHGFWRTSRWMQSSLCGSRQPRPLQPLMYEALCEARGCNMHGLFSSRLFVVTLCIVKQEHATESARVWNTYCHLLSAERPRRWRDVSVFSATTCCSIRHSDFWKSIKCLDGRGARGPVSAKMCTRSSYDSSLVSG